MTFDTARPRVVCRDCGSEIVSHFECSEGDGIIVVQAGEAAGMERWPITVAIEDIEANRPVRAGVRFRVVEFLRAALATGETS